MAITPFKPSGVGMTDSINVFRITFSTALSDIPILTAYDDYTLAATGNTIFIGTAAFTRPMIAAVGEIAPGVADWYPASEAPGNSSPGVPNTLNGTVAGAKLSTAAPGAGASVTFNLGYKIPSDVTTLATMDAAVTCEYQYTGSVPTVSFTANDNTEGSPNWVAIDSKAGGDAPTAGTVTQVRPCDTGRGADGDASYRMTIPASGTAYPDEIWVKDYA